MNGDVTATDFNFYLSKFLFSRSGGKYEAKFRFAGNLTCGKLAPKILVAVIDFSFVKFDGPGQWISALDMVKKIARESKSHRRGNDAKSYSCAYLCDGNDGFADYRAPNLFVDPHLRSADSCRRLWLHVLLGTDNRYCLLHRYKIHHGNHWETFIKEYLRFHLDSYF